MDKNSDIEIINAIKTGEDTWALNLLYKTSLPIIVRFITRNNGDKEEAKDIFQDAVISLYNTIKLGKYDPSKEINAFLFHVAKNRWINRVKKKNRHTGVDKLEQEMGSESPYSILVSEEQQSAVDLLMVKVGTPCKEVLRYVMYEKLNMKEIAERMGFAGETVAKATHYRCKQKLAALIFENKNLLALLKDERG